MIGVAGPGEADARPALFAEPLRPHAREVGLCVQIWDVRRDRLQTRAERERQAEQRALPVERRQRLAAGDDLDSANAVQQAQQGRLHLEHHARAAGDDQRHIPAELDGVAETLLAMNQDRLPGNRLAAPERLAEIAARANERLLVPAPLVAGPAVLIIAGEELQQRLVPARLDVTGID